MRDLHSEQPAIDAPGKVLVITGCTGFLGSHFLYRLLERADKATRFVAIARGADSAVARARVVAALSACAASYAETPLRDLSRLTVVSGDILLPLCGLTDEHLRAVSSAEGADPPAVEIWHLAASLQFEERNRSSIFEHNLHGTRNVLAAAERLGASRFVYVSTAYTAGERCGQIEEVLHPIEGPFCNPYEESKCLAEHEVVQACAARGADAQILRPSIVIGPHKTLKSGGTTSGFYGFFRELYNLRETLANVERKLIIEGDGSLPINIVPVDHVVADMLELIDSGFAGRFVHHLTSCDPPQVEAVVAMACRFAGVRVIGMGKRTEKRVPIERVLDRRISFYRAYMKNPKQFDRHLPRRRQVTLADVAGYYAECGRELDRTDSESFFEETLVTGIDGTPMRAFSAGSVEAPVVVFVNAYGMSADFFVPLAKALAPHYRVITWELRGLPNTAVPFAPDACSVEDYARDLERVLDFYGVHRAHFIGWCSGALLLLRFVTLFPDRSISMALLNGTFGGLDDAPLSDFEKKVFQIIPHCARGPKYARLFCDVVFGNQRAEPSHQAEEDRMNGILDHIEPGLVHMTSAPFRTAEALYRYAFMLERLRELPASGWAQEARIPSLVVGGAKDLIVSPEASSYIASRIQGARLVMREAEDHFLLYNDATLPPLLAEFFGEHEARGASRANAREPSTPGISAAAG